MSWIVEPVVDQSIFSPNSEGIWLKMMLKQAAEKKPFSTGSDTKSRMKPSLRNPTIKA